MAERLTKAQLKLLERLADDEVACRPRRGSAAHALRMADYADWNDRAGNGLWWLKITPAGREALKEASGHG